MTYSDTTNKNGIIQMEESLCLLGDGGISGNATLLAQFTGYNNSADREIKMAIMSVDKNNKSDDFNYTDYPDAPVTMVLDQADYTVPVASVGANVATFLRLNGIYFILNGEKTYLRKMAHDEATTTTSGVPTSYKLHGKSIIFNCPFNQATLTLYSSTFHVEFQRTNDPFTVADTTQQPGFMETYHDLIPLRASAWYLLPTNPDIATRYEQRFYTRLELLKRDIAMTDDNTPRRLTANIQNNK